MTVVSIINYKGGVGKTTVTANLAAELAFRGKKVLMIDTDPQASLTFSFIEPAEWHENYSENKTIKTWFDQLIEQQTIDLKELIITPQKTSQIIKGGKLDLICSHLALINVDLELAHLLGGSSIQVTKNNYLKVHSKLREALQKILKNKTYDIILIDCPPNFNIVTKNALVASSKLLIPAKPDYLSTLGIDYLHRSINLLVKEFNEYAENSTIESINPQHMGVLFTMIQIHGQAPISAQQQFIAQTKRLNFSVFDSFIRENKSIFADAPRDGVPVVLNRYSTPTHNSVVTEIENFVTEFQNKLNQVI